MGMSLSEILGRLEKLEKIDTEQRFLGINILLDDVKRIRKGIKFINADIDQSEKELQSALSRYDTEIINLREKIRSIVFNDEAQFLAQNKKIYYSHFNNMTFDEHLEWSKSWSLGKDSQELFFQQISSNIHWQQPTLVFGAGDSSLIKTLVAAEPLYVMERYQDYFEMQKTKFTAEYARRIRFYTPDEFQFLPANIFSVIAIYNQFNFLPWETTSKYLDYFARNLAPGGMLIFNFNNCKTSKGFRNFEQQLMTYSTPDMFDEHCGKLGLQLVKEHTSSRESFSFLVYQRPGSLKLIKRFPAVGMVKTQPTVQNLPVHNNRLARLKKIFKS